MKRSLRSVVLVSVVTLAAWPALVGAGEEEDFFRFESMPKFESTSGESVLLRYKLKTGQVMKMTISTDTEVVVRQGAQEMKNRESVAFEAKASVTGVDPEGNISALVKITRFQMKISGAQEISFDSDDAESADEAFKPLTAMVNVGISCKMSPVGEMLETDLEPLRLAMRRAGNAAFAEAMDKTTDKMFEGAFTELAKEPVKVGETYKAGTIVEDQSKIHMSYKIASVSGDRRQALLEPIAEMEIKTDAFPGAEVEMKKSRIGGWMLHDVVRGFVSDAEVHAYMVMEVKAEGETGTAEVKVTMKMKATLSE